MSNPNPRGNPAWKKGGASPNPTGRGEDKFGKLVREKKGLPEKLLAETLALLDSKDETVKLKAIIFLKESGWGRAVQQIESESLNELVRTILIFPKKDA